MESLKTRKDFTEHLTLTMAEMCLHPNGKVIAAIDEAVARCTAVQHNNTKSACYTRLMDAGHTEAADLIMGVAQYDYS